MSTQCQHSFQLKSAYMPRQTNPKTLTTGALYTILIKHVVHNCRIRKPGSIRVYMYLLQSLYSFCLEMHIIIFVVSFIIFIYNVALRGINLMQEPFIFITCYIRKISAIGKAAFIHDIVFSYDVISFYCSYWSVGWFSNQL